ncbi:response regulator [Hymenobacter terricola]|uniref:hypothetical protein n=1 Tax=Hymenobacter terricola TaxID=2819236 RepID=UPI001B30782D|nr:hypothetical protein [Hymenobacter terricola]
MKTFPIDDDNLAIPHRTIVAGRAEGFSNSICTFQSAGGALDILVKGKKGAVPQVVFLDLNMPVMNGWQFLDALAPYKGRAVRKMRHLHSHVVAGAD